MKTAGLALAAVLVTTAAAAEPNYPQQFYRWLYPPKASPMAPVPIPVPQRKAQPETKLAPAPESARAIPEKAVPEVARKAKPRPVDRPAQKPRVSDEARPKIAPISCSDARQGVGMPCFLIRANAYRYEGLSSEQKRQVDSCLTAAERAAILACFR